MRRGQQPGTGSGRAGSPPRFSVTLKRNGASIKVKVGDTVASLKAGNATLTVADVDGVWTVAPLAVNAGSTIKSWCANLNGDAVFRSAVAI